jgi:serine/threonine protein kinase
MFDPPILSGFRTIEHLLETPTCSLWRAIQGTLDRPVILIEIAPEICVNTVYLQTILKSLRTLTQSRSQLFPDVIDVLTKNRRDYIILEDANIHSLFSLLKGRRLNAEQLLTLADQIAEGFAQLQSQNVVYNVFSPQRLFLTEDYAPILPDVTPAIFGNTFTLDHPALALDSMDVIWRAPEQCSYNTYLIDARADIFAVGMTLYAFATGQAPFGSLTPEAILEAKLTTNIPSPCDISPNFPPALAAILSKMTQRDLDLRYSDWDEIRFDLYHARQGVVPPIHSPETSVIAPPNPSAKKFAGTTIRLSVKDLKAYRSRHEAKKRPIPWLTLLIGSLIALILITLGLFIWVTYL